jgi:TRAP-type mannitol/chloroaromatic compound transport system permease large subunit
VDAAAIGQFLSVAMFFGLIAALMFGYPIAFTLPGIALAFAILGWTVGAFDLTYLGALPLRYFGVITNEVLVAIPLFVFMGVMLERSRLAETLLITMGELFGSLRGGLGISTIVVATLLAASTGIVGATVVTMGLISLPAMLRAGYDKRLA